MRNATLSWLFVGAILLAAPYIAWGRMVAEVEKTCPVCGTVFEAVVDTSGTQFFLKASWQEEAEGENHREDLQKSLQHFEAYLQSGVERGESWQTAQLVKGELLRRLGHFQKADEHFQLVQESGLFQGGLPERVAEFERKLIALGDSDPHAISEMNRGDEGETSERAAKPGLGARRLVPLVAVSNTTSDDPAGQQPTLGPPSMSAVPDEILELKTRITNLETEVARLRRLLGEGAADAGSSSGRRGLASPVDAKVIVNNRTPFTQDLEINGQRYAILPGTNSVKVQYGEVRTHLWPEIPKVWDRSNWRWNGREHELTIAIGYR